jgi:hypothetical protein
LTAHRKPKQEAAPAPSKLKAGSGVDLRAFHRLITKRFPKILAELAK